MTEPQLLVSVRSEDEARAAIAGGCDILDVKEPDRGPLGAASLDVIAGVAEIAAASGIPSSAALGEAASFVESDLESKTGLPMQLFNLPRPPSFVKAGPAGLAQVRNGLDRWIDLVRDSSESPDRPRWVAVIYADWAAAQAPSPDEILDAVLSCSSDCFPGVLVDTFDKRSRSLLEMFDPAQLGELAERVHETGRFLALAGRLREDHLERLVPGSADIIAVRSAACENGNRRARVCAAAVRRLRHLLKQQHTTQEEVRTVHVGQPQ